MTAASRPPHPLATRTARRYRLAAPGREARAERALRTLWGLLLVRRPEVLIRLCAADSGRARRRARRVLRVLGTRHLLQAAAGRRMPAALAAGTDAAHAATSAALACGSRRWRTGAAVDTAVASAFAASGLYRHARRHPAPPPRGRR